MQYKITKVEQHKLHEQYTYYTVVYCTARAKVTAKIAIKENKNPKQEIEKAIN